VFRLGCCGMACRCSARRHSALLENRTDTRNSSFRLFWPERSRPLRTTLVSGVDSCRSWRFSADWFSGNEWALMNLSVELAPFRQNRETNLARRHSVAHDDLHVRQPLLECDFGGGADARKVHCPLEAAQRKILARVVKSIFSVLQMNSHGQLVCIVG